jgi:excisionase family DNA binding protein
VLANPFLTVPEVARLLGRTPSRCYQLARVGALPVVRIGGRLVVPRAALEEWVRLSGERALRTLRPDADGKPSTKAEGLPT